MASIWSRLKVTASAAFQSRAIPMGRTHYSVGCIRSGQGVLTRQVQGQWLTVMSGSRLETTPKMPASSVTSRMAYKWQPQSSGDIIHSMSGLRTWNSQGRRIQRSWLPQHWRYRFRGFNHTRESSVVSPVQPRIVYTANMAQDGACAKSNFRDGQEHLTCGQQLLRQPPTPVAYTEAY